MKYNAFKVCEEVSQRVDGGVAPGSYIKAWVTPDEDSLFFWDQEHLHHYLANKDNQKFLVHAKIITGQWKIL